MKVRERVRREERCKRMLAEGGAAALLGANEELEEAA